MTTIAAAAPRATVGIAWALVAFALFSTVDTLVKLAAAALPVAQVAFFTTLAAAVPIGAVVWREGGFTRFWPEVPGLVLLRAVFATSTSLCAWNAFARLPLADAYALIFTVPLWVTVLSVPVLGERVRIRRASAVVVGFAGVLVMLRPGDAGLGLGHLFAAGAALSAAAAMLTTRIIGRRARGGVQLAALSLLMLVVTAPAVAAAPPALDAATLALLVGAGGLLGLAQFAIWTALQHGPAAVVSPFQYSQLLWATLYGALVFGDWPTASTLAGAFVVIASGLYVMHRERVTRPRA
jgi:S-adenosylmethionine uptake transporter